MKRIIIPAAVLIGIIVAGLILTRWRSSPSFGHLNEELQYLVSAIVEKDGSVKSCVLAVMKGDGSFSWSGAAGIARQEGQVPMSQVTPIHIASITKLFTATAIMRLYEERALSLDDPMSKHVPEELIQGIHVYKGKDYSREITIKELLSHTSGIADYYSEKPKGGKSLFELFLEKPERSWTVDETIDRARDLGPNFAPGTDTSYSDTNFQLLGKVIESVTGKPLHIVYDYFFFRPLGLDHTWLIGRSQPRLPSSAAPADIFFKDRIITNIRSNGSYWADGGIISTAQECITFLKALKEGHIVKKNTLELMHHWRKIQFPLQYGYGTMYFKLPRFINVLLEVPPLWGHSGSTGSFLYYSEDLDLYLAGSINQTESGSKSKPFKLMLKVMKAVQRSGAKMKLAQSLSSVFARCLCGEFQLSAAIH